MSGSRQVVLALSLLNGLLGAASIRGQAPTPPAMNADLPNLLPGLPRPPDAPPSLFAAPAVVPAPPYLPGSYFQPDPLLDPPGLPQPGWFAGAEAGLFGTHLTNHLSEKVTVGARAPDTVQLNTAPLNWVVAPRFEVGRRLSSGFGEISVSYRFLITQGAGTMPAPDALAALTSHFDLNVIDFDYGSREISLWPLWEMKWRAGVRWAFLRFDAQATEQFAVAAAGSGIFQTRETNYFGGVGPHLTLELSRHLGASPWSLYGQVDGGWLLGHVTQNFFETSTTPLATGGFLGGQTHDNTGQSVPMVSSRLGLQWRPPALPCCEIFMGYQFEQWWNVGRNDQTGSRGQFYDRGAFVRGAITF